MNMTERYCTEPDPLKEVVKNPLNSIVELSNPIYEYNYMWVPVNDTPIKLDPANGKATVLREEDKRAVEHGVMHVPD